ncbi:MAG: HD domain-containing phosphohydrolase [Planctomycetota bacterium]
MQLNTVLVVDDERRSRRRYKEILDGNDTEVEFAQDGYEACAKIKLGVDAVLLDSDMPGMDGYEALRRIREDNRYSDIPVIMACPHNTKNDRLRALEAGANDVVCTSLSGEEIALRVKTQLQMKNNQDRLEKQLTELRRTTRETESELRKALSGIAAAQRGENRAHMEAVRTLSVVAESKDETTGKHVSRIGHYSRLLGELYGLPPGETAMLTLASTAHDVGKVATPRSILCKPGPLNDEEWEIMTQHPTVGAQILNVSSSPILRAGKTIALTHHEKWDGSGYPQGLEGEDIPIWGRICAVADVFDALTSDRPYRDAMDADSAGEIIEDNAGSHLDPDLAGLFLDNFDRVLEIKELEPDVFHLEGELDLTDPEDFSTAMEVEVPVTEEWQLLVDQLGL